MTETSAHRAEARRPRGLVDLRLDELFGSADRLPAPAEPGDRFAEEGGGDVEYDDLVETSRDRLRSPGRLAQPQPSDTDPSGPGGGAPSWTPRSGRPGGRDGGPRGPVDQGRADARPLGGALWRRAGRLSRWRIDPQRRGAVAVLGAILVAALAVGWQALAARPHSQPVADPLPVSIASRSGPGSGGVDAATTGSTTAVAGPATSSARVIVDVVGRVHRPGLVTLRPGARVADAVRAAGGALPGTNLSSINLARVCVDGEQIAVGVAGALPPAGSGATAGSTAPAAPVNLNTATADQLDALPGVGPVMAQRIIAYRTDHGPFTSVDQLRQVSGIGDAKFADLSPLVTVG